MPNKEHGQGPSSKTCSKRSKKSAQFTAEGAEEEPLVAVILADSFDRRFSPLTLFRPRCLLPFCGVPLINFSLERLLQAQVSNVHILANSHAHLIRHHIDSLRKVGALFGMDVVVHSVPDARSVGDAMRELDSKELIRGDFILLQPDCVGNVNIKEQVRIHAERRKADKDVIMTIGTMQISLTARNSPRAARAIMAVRPGTDQLLHYDPEVLNPIKTSLPFEKLFSDANPEVELRWDLRETGVDICSFEVPPLFSENFDYQALRSDFVVGILTSDLLDSKLYVHVGNATDIVGPGASTSYGARCDSTKAYDGIVLDFLNRASWPMAPGCPAWPGERLEARQGSRYIGTSGVNIDRSALVSDKVLASSGVTIGAESYVAGSTLAPGTRIAEQSSILRSHLFEKVAVGRGCSISSAIVGRDVTILDNVIIEQGCLIGDGCVLGPDVTLPAGSRMGLKKLEDLASQDDNEEKDTPARRPQPANAGRDARLGSQSIGHLWPSLLGGGGSCSKKDAQGSLAVQEVDSDSEDEDEDEEESPQLLRRLLIGFTEADFSLRSHQAPAAAGEGDDENEDGDDGLSSIEGDSEFDEEDGEDGASVVSSVPSRVAGGEAALSSKLGSLNLSGETHYEAAAASERLAEFNIEASASLSRAFAEAHTIENASIELKTLRMASNVPQGEVRRVVTESLLSTCIEESGGGKDFRKMASWLDRWSPLLASLLSGASSSDGDEQDSDIINVMQTFCSSAEHHMTHMALFVPLLKKFYNDDVLGDEALIAWWKSPSSRDPTWGQRQGSSHKAKATATQAAQEAAGERRLELRKRAEAVVRWVAEQDDEDSDSEEDNYDDDN